MGKILFQYLFMIISIIFLTSCGRNEKLIYSAPTISQINEFISKNSINAISIKEASDFAVVLFKNGQEYGHYVIYKDQYNELYSSKVSGIGGPKDNPLSLGGVASGNTPFVTMIINDKNMLANAKEVEITFKDGSIAKETISGKGTVVLHRNDSNKEPITYRNLVIYDKDMKKLYED